LPGEGSLTNLLLRYSPHSLFYELYEGLKSLSHFLIQQIPTSLSKFDEAIALFLEFEELFGNFQVVNHPK
jgi:hypothetical protein